jgi:hypothetical protein
LALSGQREIKSVAKFKPEPLRRKSVKNIESILVI